MPTTKTSFIADNKRSGNPTQLTYYEFGRTDNPNKLICVHGLARNGRDFDFLAAELAQHYHVISVDMPGRGKSPWLTNKEEYTYPHYVSLLKHFIDAQNFTKLDWVGTSMGGVIGMVLAATYPDLIKRLVINDIGALVPKEGLQRIAGYLGSFREHTDLNEMKEQLRQIYVSFGIHDPLHWEHLFTHGIQQTETGGYRMAFDPGILEPMRKETKNYTEFKDIDLGMVWKKVMCPVLLVRGKQSDILPAQVAADMRKTHSDVTLYEVEGVGHAPALMEDEQIRVVSEWLLKTPAIPKHKQGLIDRFKRWCLRKFVLKV